MLKNSFALAAVIFTLGLSSAALANECKLCVQLSQMGTDFVKGAEAKRAPRGSKARDEQELKEAAALNKGAEVAIKILEDKNLDDEKLESVAMYLAITAERDGLHLVMDSILGDFKKGETQLIAKVRAALVRLKAKKQISPREFELVEDSIAVVLTPDEG